MRIATYLLKTPLKIVFILFAIQIQGVRIARAEIPPCTLNSPIPGESPSGFASVVFSPVDFNKFESSSEEILFYEGYQSSKFILIFNIQSLQHNIKPDPVELKFFDGARVVHHCSIVTVNPNETGRKPQEWAYGNCGMENISGPEVLRPGVLQVIRMPQPLEEGAIHPSFIDKGKDIVDYTMITKNLVAFYGLRPGLAVFVAVMETEDEQFSASICPVIVAEPDADNHVKDSALCHDPDGNPLRMKIGQRAEIAADGFAPGDISDQEVQFANPEVVAVVGGGGAHRVVVEAKAPGKTSLLLRSLQARAGVSCMIVVE